MDRPVGSASFGQQLRRWRRHRGLSQLGLALDAGVSARHLSWLENDKAQPSRVMVLRLAQHMDLPLRERNGLLLAAGFSPLYAERPLSHPALGVAREALQTLLDAHEPWPALAVDRHWTLVAGNRMVPLLLQAVAPALREPPVNVLRVALHAHGLAPMIENLTVWREHLLARLQRQWLATADTTLGALLEELRGYPAPADHCDDAAAEPDAVALPLVLHTPFGRLAFITTLTVFGAPHDVALSELAVETLLPTDTATADTLRRLHSGLG